jgi:hypothetical protein
MFCRQCGNKLSDGAKFCAKCGYKVQEGTHAEVPGNNTTSTSEIKVQETATEDKPKKKSKLWLWILLIVLVLGLGATVAVLYCNYVESVEEDADEDDEKDEDDEDDDKDKDSDSDSDDEDSMGAYGEYVDKSEKTATMQMIGTTMDVLEILAADPAVEWELGEVVYVRFTADGNVYGSDREDIISNMEMILGEDMVVKTWYGFEIWAKKTENGWVEFATSWDYDEMEEISPEFASRFSMTSVQP